MDWHSWFSPLRNLVELDPTPEMVAIYMFSVLVVAVLFAATVVVADDDSCDHHPDFSAEDAAFAAASGKTFTSRANDDEKNAAFWNDLAKQHISDRLETTLNTNRAKNIIMLLGDGMSLTTVAATRMYLGAEEMSLSFEKFPHFGLSKTYCVDSQVADSACTATAYLTGIKANYGTMGINGQVNRYQCDLENESQNQAQSIARWAQDNCKVAGLVTTARVTHASPGGVYAHTANRDWENDAEVRSDNCDPEVTIDIARQLVEGEVGSNLRVVLGGGRREFRPTTVLDEEQRPGYRTDGRDLIEQWQDHQHNLSRQASYIWNREQLLNIDYANTDYLMGLFEDDHINYNLEREEDATIQESDPTLAEMTEAAIKLLSKSENGYFLFVESGRIDMGHHDNMARKALDETAEFSRVVEMVRQMTNESDTLIVVTSDHGHVMTYNGYPLRGNNILGLSGRTGSDSLPYTTLSYANGMGYYNTYNENGQRKDQRLLDFTDHETEYPAMVPRDSETHGGEDVGVYASGPWSHLFVGNYEQNAIPVAMAYAARIGPFAEAVGECSSAISVHVSLFALLGAVAAACLARF